MTLEGWSFSSLLDTGDTRGASESGVSGYVVAEGRAEAGCRFDGFAGSMVACSLRDVSDSWKGVLLKRWRFLAKPCPGDAVCVHSSRTDAWKGMHTVGKHSRKRGSGPARGPLPVGAIRVGDA